MHRIFDVIFIGTATCLRNSKSMDHPVAYIFSRYDGVFVAGCVVQYFPNEDESNPGNWNMAWTFNENDIPENAVRISLDKGDSHSFFIGVAGNKYGMRFLNESGLVTCIITALEQLKKYLDENVKENQECVIEQEGLFQARAAVENGEKVFSIEADGEVKNLIKDDAMIEK